MSNSSNQPRIIGKVFPQMKGEYDSNYNYEILDEVQQATAMYRSKRNGNIGHPVTDTDWWTKTFDAGVAIDEASKNNQATENDKPVEIARLIGVGTDGQIYSIKPETLVEYVLQELKSYNIVCASK